MLISRTCYLSYLINCIVLELISGQINESISYENYSISRTNSTLNQLFTKSHNISVILDNSENIDQFNENTTDVLNICDNIICINDIAICEVNHCNGIRRIRKIHYVVTCIIVAGVILLTLATMYACHQQSKRSIQWHNAHHRCEEHLMALRILQSVNRNIEMGNIRETIPLQNSNESPPPYEFEYTPPPNYHEAASHDFNQYQK